MSGINLDHDRSTIRTDGDVVLKLGDNGAILFGDGTNVNPLGNEGVLRYNSTLHIMEISDGTIYKEFGKAVDPIDSIIFAIIFGG